MGLTIKRDGGYVQSLFGESSHQAIRIDKRMTAASPIAPTIAATPIICKFLADCSTWEVKQPSM